MTDKGDVLTINRTISGKDIWVSSRSAHDRSRNRLAPIKLMESRYGTPFASAAVDQRRRVASVALEMHQKEVTPEGPLDANRTIRSSTKFS
jgi:hypothetical protein